MVEVHQEFKPTYNFLKLCVFAPLRLCAKYNSYLDSAKSKNGVAELGYDIYLLAIAKN
jgi:hypothetical protein